ncbi:MAG: hypothetical protein WCT46_01295 [Candidatus Gracilibacteria bacterium]|jgi:hypothetical protein
MKKLIILITILTVTGCAQPVQTQVTSPVTTYITSEGIGQIAVQIEFPSAPRYEEGAPIIVYTPSTFFTRDTQEFVTLKGITDQGFIEISMNLPGRGGSDGTNDYGGEDSMKAFRDVVKFASGDLKNTDGKTLCELIPIEPLYSDVGIYAFSHPGILATNTLATYGSELQGVDYFVGRENPTNDQLSALEVGQYVQLYEDGGESGMKNTLYDYTEDYSPEELTIDYSSIRYDQETATLYFDKNLNGKIGILDEYVFGEKVPEMFGKKCYSVALLTALRENGSIASATWPEDLATPEEASEWWSIRETNDYYSLLADSLPNLKVMLVFADLDHVQTAADKPHIHQAYDGFHEIAGLWTRLNPDSSYLKSLDIDMEHDANTEPEDWGEIDAWAYKKSNTSNVLVPIAGILEMADRTYYGEWGENLTEALQK